MTSFFAFMGRITSAKEIAFLIRQATTLPLRCFSVSATSAVPLTQFSHARAFCRDGRIDVGNVLAADDASSHVGSSDFVFRHAYKDGPFAAFKTGRLTGLYRKDLRQEGVILKLQVHSSANESLNF